MMIRMRKWEWRGGKEREGGSRGREDEKGVNTKKDDTYLNGANGW